MNIIQLVMSYAAMEAQSRMKEAISPVAPYLRRLMVGVVIMLSGIGAMWLGFIFLALSVFTQLLELPDFTMPALWTGLIFIGVGLILFGSGLLMIRRPRL
jgi:uncharacterized membrane protein YphA (DoxX/SURF4 family)